MRSFAVKLTLAFLLIGLIGVVLVALLLGLRTRQEFDRFVTSRDYSLITDALGDYYAQHGNWRGVAQIIPRYRFLAHHLPRLTIVDTAGQIVFNHEASSIGTPFVRQGRMEHEIAIAMDDQPVGTVFIADLSPPTAGAGRPPSEDVFLHNVNFATLMSALIAALIALLLGIFFARMLVRPVRELTVATQVVAEGKLGHQVAIRANDELGKLAASFNQMSRDLAQASQMRKQMTADIAHDLRTPLTILRGYTEGLKESTIQGAPPLYAMMYEEVLQLQHLVEDLRTLSLADAGELSLNRRAVDPQGAVGTHGIGLCHAGGTTGAYPPH